MFVGALLVLVGVLMLLNQFGILPGRSADYFVPVALVALGISLITKHRKKMP